MKFAEANCGPINVLIMNFNIKNSSVPTLFIWYVTEAQIKFHFASNLHVVTVPLRLGDNVKGTWQRGGFSGVFAEFGSA